MSLQAAGCNPPTATVGKEALSPGESTQVRVGLQVAHTGHVMKTVKLLTNDLYHPIAFLTLQGRIPHDLRVSPDRLRFTHPRERPFSRMIHVSGPPGLTIHATSSARGLFVLRARGPETADDGRTVWRVEIALKPAARVGDLEDELQIHTNHPQRPLLTIPVKGRVVGDLAVTPSAAFFGFLRVGQPAQQEFVIHSRYGSPFAVKSVKSSNATVQTSAPAMRQGQWVVSVAVDTSAVGVVKGSVTVFTDLRGEDQLVVPVYAHVLQ